MQRFLILLLLIALCNCINAQQSDGAKDILNLVTSSMKPTYHVFTDNANLSTFDIKQVNIYLEKDTILYLSLKEKKELQTKLLAALHAPKWQGNTLNGIPLIKTDTVKKVMGNASKIWEYFKKKFPEPFSGTLNGFSKPIFIRNNTICLFYVSSSRYAGLDLQANEEEASKGELCFYIKIDNVWLKKITLYSYVT